jgi:hypothetical protein
MGSADDKVLVEQTHIYPWGGAGLQTDLVPVYRQPVSAERVSQGIDRTAQSGAPAGAVRFGPQEVDQGVSGMALLGDGEIGDKGNSLAPV